MSSVSVWARQVDLAGLEAKIAEYAAIAERGNVRDSHLIPPLLSELRAIHKERVASCMIR